MTLTEANDGIQWSKIPCQYCGTTFSNLHDHREHERCHIKVKTELNSHPADGGPVEILWEDTDSE